MNSDRPRREHRRADRRVDRPRDRGATAEQHGFGGRLTEHAGRDLVLVALHHVELGRRQGDERGEEVLAGTPREHAHLDQGIRAEQHVGVAGVADHANEATRELLVARRWQQDLQRGRLAERGGLVEQLGEQLRVAGRVDERELGDRRAGAVACARARAHGGLGLDARYRVGGTPVCREHGGGEYQRSHARCAESDLLSYHVCSSP
jgi:hypothetical protein